MLCLVTGANGHLGNTLVRLLLEQGHTVRAGVRNINQRAAFAGLACEVVYAELLDEPALLKALEGVEVLFQVAAVFKHWAKHPEADIIQPNVQGTRCVLQAASRAGVKRVVYVSSVAAVGHDGSALDETVWGEEVENAYYRSKILSEQMAWQTANALGLWMVSVLPSAMVGPNAGRLTDTLGFLQSVKDRKLPLDPGFHFNFVDVRDVAMGMLLAAQKGRAGQRYILANAHSSSLGELTQLLGQRQPPPAPRWLLMGIAWVQERWAQLSGQPAQLMRSQVRLFHHVRQQYNTTKAKVELGFNPRPPQQALHEAFAYLDRRAVQPYDQTTRSSGP